jgi:hypothetical protein
MTQCSKIDNDGVPSYIYIDTIGLETNILTQGFGSLQAPVVWIDAGGKDMGAWELPALIPILKEGESNIIISAGIMKGAISDFYKSPFYDIYQQKVNLIKTKVDTIRPIVKFSPRASFMFNEDFENGTKFNNIGVESKNIPSMGANTGVLYTTDSQKVSSSIDFINVSDSTKEMYIEFDYKTDIDTALLFINLQFDGMTSPVKFGFVKCRNYWKRAYFPIHDYVNVAKKRFKTQFAILKPLDKNSSTIYLDNIKVIYLK